MRSEIIIVLDLCGELLAAQSQLRYEGISQFYPVRFWKRCIMCIEVASGSSEFCAKGYANELFDLVLYPFGKDDDFFPKCCRAGRLTMCMRQHGNIFPFFRQQFELRIKV